jgi:hypothetical protein
MTRHTSPFLSSVESQFNKLQVSEKFLFDCGDFSSTLTRPLDSSLLSAAANRRSGFLSPGESGTGVDQGEAITWLQVISGLMVIVALTAIGERLQQSESK